MLTILGGGQPFCDGITRRGFLTIGGLAMGGLSLPDILRANVEFHRRLSELAGNQRVTTQLNLTLDYVTRLDTLCTQTVPGWIGHADILQGIETRQPAEACRAMQDHIDASRDKMIQLFSR